MHVCFKDIRLSNSEDKVEKKKLSKLNLFFQSITKGKFGKIFKRTKVPSQQEQRNVYELLSDIYNIGESSICLVKLVRTNEFFVKKTIKQKDFFENELKILRRIGSHMNIIKLIESVESFNKEKSLIYEYANGGDLCTEITKYGKFHGDKADRIMLQIFSALEFIHSKSIIHRDIKLENIVCFRKKQVLTHVKLIDFGLSTIYDEKNPEFSLVGTVGYIAPEMFLNEPHTCAVDIWSCAIVMITVYTGHHPLNPNQYTVHEISRRTINVEIDKSFFQPLESFIENLIQFMLTKSSKERATAEMVVDSLTRYRLRKKISIVL